ncbi:hypothetical protein EC973_000472 [Apophysomyces ossiformis]|uniref:Nuclear condensin complex subunit 3 C-terminal domain-containing protein n=1 Tax=Apophysomyces ossiformis TaxID=679940 RepID=A0A8H7BQP5_9FUNG|nr:hypothetical protein EC973_000472 [Apophysomyces ossiformis]
MSTNTSRKTAAIASLSTTLPQIFNDAQKPNANQRKHAISLRKIQEQCCLNEPIIEGTPHNIDIDGEKAFVTEVIRNLNRILQIRKREPHADRIIRFVASFMQYTQQLDSKDEDEEEKSEDMEEDLEETLSSRFVEFLMRHLLKGLVAKSKSVRFRCCQIIALSINSLGEIDEDLYQDLKQALFERIRDKEPPVRIQAATALTRLHGADTEVDENDGKTITQKLLWRLQYDDSAEVRRVILFNLEATQETIPYIIERARDVDAINRRVVFLKPMADISDFTLLNVSDRHKLLKWGLNDRDPLVRRAASKMIATLWIRHADNNLLEYDDKLDAILPEVTRHAFIIQKYNALWQQTTNETEGDYEFIVMQLLDIAKCLDYADEVGRRKMFVLLREILMVPDIPDDHLSTIVALLKMISLDEIDFTRTMVEIISDIQEIANNEEDDELLRKGTPFKKLKMDDKLNRRNRGIPDDENQSDSENEEDDSRSVRKSLSQLKCLSICKCMLEHSEEALHDNSTVYGLINDLIVPSVQSKEIVLREEGLHCLGLCCCLDKALGLHNISLFVHCLKNGHEELQQKALMILFDIMTAYGVSSVVSKLKNFEELRELFEFALNHDSNEIQAIATEGLAKLLLLRILQDNEVCISALQDLCETYTELEEDEEMVSPSLIADMLADWTDPRKITEREKAGLNTQDVDKGIQADVAVDVLKAITRETGLTRKTMVHILSKLYIEEASEERLQKMLELIEPIEKDMVIKEAMVRNSFNRFAKSVRKHYQPYSREETPVMEAEEATETVPSTPASETQQ